MTERRGSLDPGRPPLDSRSLYRLWWPIFGIIAVLQGVAAIAAFIRGSIPAGVAFTITAVVLGGGVYWFGLRRARRGASPPSRWGAPSPWALLTRRGG